MNQNEPLVSVLITVYNGMPLLKEVIEHLQKQTYKNIEIVAVDDASTDESLAYLQSVSHHNLKLITEGKLGRGKALNAGLAHCTGKYVAVNDADDLSFPDRIRKQVEFLEENPEYGLVGSNFIKSFSEEKKEYTNKSLTNEALRAELSLHSCIQHSAAMFRKSVMDQVGGYNLNIRFLYDRDIYIRVAAISKISNLPDHLVSINRHENQYFNSTFKGLTRQIFTLKLCFKAIALLNLPKYLYITRTFNFLKSLLLNFIKNSIKRWKK
jgi:glycosyltransferase involved in cell wall biosynthesis